MTLNTTLLIVLSLLVAGVLSFFLYYYKAKNKSKLILFLAFLRFVSIFGLLLLLINPVISTNSEEIIKPTLSIVVDNSSSIKTLNGDKTAVEVYTALVGDKNLNEKFDIQSYQFDSEFQESEKFDFTGTQSNLCGVLAHCQRGDEYIVGQQAHTYRWEGGGAAVLGSVQPQPITHAADGTLLLADIESAIKPDDAHFAKSRLLALENTIGGKLLPMAYVIAATNLAKSKGLATHLDGARLFNAAVAQAAQTQSTALVEAKRIARCFDSVSVCFSKGLGAPVGSALCGSKEFIQRAHRIRKMAGGGMRQAGILAAAAIYALDHHVGAKARFGVSGNRRR